MSSALLRRLSPVVACVTFAVGGGLLGGATAVHGLRLNSYGDGSTPVASVANTPYVGSSESGASDSDRALGFRWASNRAIHSPVDCPSDSWNFRRGCVDYANDSGL